MSDELEKRIAKWEAAVKGELKASRERFVALEKVNANQAKKLKQLTAKVYGTHAPTLKKHGKRLDVHAEELSELHNEFSEFRRTQHSLVEAVGRVLDRQTHDSLVLEHVEKTQMRVAEQISTFGGHLAKLAKARA